MANFAPEIRKLIAQSLADQGEEYSENFLNNLKSEVSFYLMEIEETEIRFNTYFDKMLPGWNFKRDPQDITEQYERFIIGTAFLKQDHDIENTLKKGYEIIDLIRTVYTGHETTYSVGVSYKGTLYEGTLTLDQILSIAKVEAIWKNSVNNLFKLRLSGATKGQLASSYGLQAERPSTTDHSTLFSTIREYASSDKKWNQGNVFEAYRVYKAEKGNHITQGNASWDPQHFDDIFMSVRKNTASFVKGGDYFDESIKYFGDSMPSLATLANIKKTLTTFNEIISLGNLNSIKAGLSSLFEKDPVLDGVDTDLENASKEEVEKILKLLKIAQSI